MTITDSRLQWVNGEGYPIAAAPSQRLYGQGIVTDAINNGVIATAVIVNDVKRL